MKGSKTKQCLEFCNINTFDINLVFIFLSCPQLINILILTLLEEILRNKTCVYLTTLAFKLEWFKYQINKI